MEAVESLNEHPPLYSDSFPESSRVKHWFSKDIGELGPGAHTPIGELSKRSGCEFGVEEPVHGGGLPNKLKTVKEHFFNVLTSNRSENFEKVFLRFLQSELTGCDYSKKVFLKARFENHTHVVDKPSKRTDHLSVADFAWPAFLPALLFGETIGRFSNFSIQKFEAGWPKMMFNNREWTRIYANGKRV